MINKEDDLFMEYPLVPKQCDVLETNHLKIVIKISNSCSVNNLLIMQTNLKTVCHLNILTQTTPQGEENMTICFFQILMLFMKMGNLQQKITEKTFSNININSKSFVPATYDIHLITFSVRCFSLHSDFIKFHH